VHDPNEISQKDLDVSWLQKESDLYKQVNTLWKSLPGRIGPYLLAAGLGIRLAAGLYDANGGWIAAKNNNLYRAIKKKTPEVSLELLPGRVPQ
jgi:hypothetical protein